MHGRERRLGFLRAARRELADGAPMLVSFFERQADTRELRWTHSGANALRRISGRPPVELGDTLAPNLVHVFTRPEFEEEAAAAGFEPAAHEVIQDVDGTTHYASATVTAT